MTMKLYVGNLGDSASEVSLKALFAPFGTVESVRIMTDRTTGEPRGFAFVRMTEELASRNAIAGLNGKDLNGQPMTVREGRTRADRQRRNGDAPQS
jgi:RNA recognition motif-containing protein